MNCNKCGKEIDENQESCPFCGEKIEEKKEEKAGDRSSRGGTLLEALLIVGTIFYFFYTMMEFDNVAGAPQQTALCVRFIAWVSLCLFCKIIPQRFDK